MTTDDLERDIRATAASWTFIRWVSTEDKTDHALKMRLHIMADCFIYGRTFAALRRYAEVLGGELRVAVVPREQIAGATPAT